MILDDLLGFLSKDKKTLKEQADEIKRKADEAEKLLNEKMQLKEQIRKDKKRYRVAITKLNPIEANKYYLIIGGAIVLIVIIAKLI